MKKIRPSGFDVTLTYECPECKSEHFSTIDETIFPAGILCYCGARLRLESIYGFDVVCSYDKNHQNKKPREEVANNDNVSLVEEVADALVGLGYKRREAVVKAKEATLKQNDLESCLKYAIS